MFVRLQLRAKLVRLADGRNNRPSLYSVAPQQPGQTGPAVAWSPGFASVVVLFQRDVRADGSASFPNKANRSVSQISFIRRRTDATPTSSDRYGSDAPRADWLPFALFARHPAAQKQPSDVITYALEAATHCSLLSRGSQELASCAFVSSRANLAAFAGLATASHGRAATTEFAKSTLQGHRIFFEGRKKTSH